MLEGMGKMSEKPQAGRTDGQTESKHMVPSGKTGRGRINPGILSNLGGEHHLGEIRWQCQTGYRFLT